MNREWDDLVRLVPKYRNQSIDWEAIEGSVISPFILEMKHTMQEPCFHGEGDVWSHVKLVSQTLIDMDEYWRFSEAQRIELFLASLLHDVGKIKTTRFQEERWISPHHGSVGMQLARRFLWTECDLAGTTEAQCVRETICLLIRYHMVPANVMKEDDPLLTLRKMASNGQLASDFNLRMLCLLSAADALGRIAYDAQEMYDMVQLCHIEAEESRCLDRPFPFPDEHTAYAYLTDRKISPVIPLYDASWGEIILLCGLPGTGKDHWIQKHYPDLPMLSLDRIRLELGIKPTENQGQIIQEAQKRAKRLLAAHQPFVFNGTNITELTRGKWGGLFERYNARVRMIFLETDWVENLRRNSSRKEAVPERVICDLLEKLTLPKPIEAQKVEWITVSSSERD